MKFLNKVVKDLVKAGIDEGSSEPPRYWYSTGNYVLNKIISGSFHKGIPQGRVVGLAGPSGSGKSFMAANIIKSAQADGAHIVVLDSENALDDDFISAVGADPTKDYTYFDVDTIEQTQKVLSAFMTGYKAEYDNSHDAPRVLIVIDSLDMLMTETEHENFDKGVTKGDMGQRAKKIKSLLRGLVQAVKRPNISIVVTCQVYANQDIMNGEGKWIVNGAVKFSLSQIVLLTKLKLKDTGSREVKGIKMKVEGFKTRFTKPYQVVTIEVPYDSGMDPFNGLLAVAVEMGIVDKRGSRYAMAGLDETWYSKAFSEYQDEVLLAVGSNTETFLGSNVEEEEEDTTPQDSVKQQRIDNVERKNNK